MKNLKKRLLLFAMAPLLFVGCVSEQNALLKPKIINNEINVTENNQTENNQTISLNFSKEENLSNENKKIISTLENNTSKENQLFDLTYSKEEPLEEPSIKENLTLNENQTFTENPIILDEQLTTQALNTDEDWKEIEKEEEVLETAKEFLGTKYVWAANGPSSFDCSGFTKYVFNQIGITLPRYSGHQANIGKKIKFENLKKGDLVFFDTEKKFTHHVNHVGIFIGNNKFIHASSAKKKVIITSFLKKKFYKKKFLYARRVITTNESVAFNLIK